MESGDGSTDRGQLGLTCRTGHQESSGMPCSLLLHPCLLSTETSACVWLRIRNSQLPPERLGLHKFGILTIRSTRLQADSTSFTTLFCPLEVSGPDASFSVAD